VSSIPLVSPPDYESTPLLAVVPASSAAVQGSARIPRPAAGGVHNRRRIALELSESEALSAQMMVLTEEVRALRSALGEGSHVSYLLSLDSAQWTLARPIPVTLQRVSDIWTASIEDFDAYGDGEERDDAMNSLRDRLLADVEELTEREAELGPHLARLLARLRAYITRVEE
jgi:hypothetical protein